MPPAVRSASRLPVTYKDGVWAKKVEFFLLWFEFLSISPSYELARRYREGTLTEEERRALPADFDVVLAVFDDLGDVQRQVFWAWWRDRGIDHFGYPGKKPSVRRIAALKRTTENAQDAVSRTEAYIGGEWQEQGRQATMILALPIGLSKAQITRQIFAHLDKIPADKRKVREAKPKYQLVGKKHDRSSLLRYFRVVWVRARLPKVALWRIGAISEVSGTYSKRIEPFELVQKNASTDDRLALKILTSRALYRGRMIAENAARGLFPSYAPCKHAVEADLQQLNALIVSRTKWQEKQQKLADEKLQGDD